MLQMLCLMAMEIPFINSANAVYNEKLKILHFLMSLDVHTVEQHTVRGQCLAGLSNGISLESYFDDLERARESKTFVTFKVKRDNWHWTEMPFYLRTGQRMFTRIFEIVVVFKSILYHIFDMDLDNFFSNWLVIHLQPDEGLKQWSIMKDPSYGGMGFYHIPLDMCFAFAFTECNPDVCEYLLMDFVRGD
ncbi:glucose-6-phosphate 1-dehydrogenase [Bartonella fuyuanensis]|uniref:Glucose-6-phosphate 1-dehydrogenase n=1 Tax=Bartonella fuyuanensis TaxID=1460968 RepID=A0A840E4X6_9HYPH|nr:glucose-6-phosphate 1-dehydrogenase [Bartonella fuyuanensis]